MADRDTLAQLDADLESLHLDGHWRGGSKSIPRSYQTSVAPHVWRWSDVYPCLERAGRLVGLEHAERRTVRLRNPGTSGVLANSSHTIHASFQMVNPGERAICHRHTMTALRFVVQGSGAYTTVGGQRCRMNRGDLILTPSRIWHDHTNEGSEPIVWLDGHDGPLLRALHQLQLDPYSEPAQPIETDSTESPDPFVGELGDSAGSDAQLIYHYPWEGAYEAMKRLRETDPQNPQWLQYPPPTPRSHGTLGTIDCRILLLYPGEEISEPRRTSSVIYHVLSGYGETDIGNQLLEWGPGDTIVVPLWTAHSISSRSREEVVLFSMSDSPVFRALQLFREEGVHPHSDTVAGPTDEETA